MRLWSEPNTQFATNGAVSELLFVSLALLALLVCVFLGLFCLFASWSVRCVVVCRFVIV